MSVYSTVAACLNLNENPEILLDYIRDTVTSHGSRLILTWIMPEKKRLLNAAVSHEDLAAQLYETGRENIISKVKAFTDAHFSGLSPEIEILEGSIEKELMRLIDKYCIDLVITGSVTTGRFGFLGGNANKSLNILLEKSRIPVMVIPNELNLECVPQC